MPELVLNILEIKNNTLFKHLVIITNFNDETGVKGGRGGDNYMLNCSRIFENHHFINIKI